MASASTLSNTSFNTAEPISQALRNATAEAHGRAEGSEFMSTLFKGELDAQAVYALSGQLWFVYSALENAVDRVSGTPIGSVIADPRLQRRAALDHDLTYCLGSDWRKQLELLPATRRYVDRLDSFGEQDVVRVIAHHYVRYLGDISGGQVIAARVADLYNVDPEALKFYDFSAIGKIPPYRTNYRQRLDSLPLTTQQRSTLIEEAIDAFGMNFALFTDLYGVCA